jgi:ABC-type Zn uptake system ZnuABC Zn-binding protein ZnuA
MLQHPESESHHALEPTVGEQLRLAEFNHKLDKLDGEELREIAKILAKQALVVQPSAIRFLAHEAARNLMEPVSSENWMETARIITDALRPELQEE